MYQYYVLLADRTGLEKDLVGQNAWVTGRGRLYEGELYYIMDQYYVLIGRYNRTRKGPSRTECLGDWLRQTVRR